MSIEAMKQMVAALEDLRDDTWGDERGYQFEWETDYPLQCEALKAGLKAIEEAEMQEQGEPVAIHQYRSPYCSDWYDGVPDHHDGHGPYEVRTLYTTPQQRKPLNDCEVCNHKVSNPDGGHCYMFRKEPEFKCANFDLAMPKCEPQPTLYVKDIDGNFHEYAHEIKG
jgi:hypothetical protein